MTWRIDQWDAQNTPWPLKDDSVHSIVTSPPYWNLRDYDTPGQLGLERTPAEYVEHMVAVFREARRVLRKDGTLWLNMGDSYITRRGGRVGGNSTLNGSRQSAGEYRKAKALRRCHRADTGLKLKDLVGMPWRLALALQDDGWWLRRDIIWSKTNGMPESVLDRPPTSHEYIFILSKGRKYFFDQDALLEPYAYGLDHHRNVVNAPESHAPGTPRHTGLRQGIKRPSGWDDGPGRHDRRDGRYRSGNKERKIEQRGPRGDNNRGSSFPWEPTGAGRPMRSVWTFAVAPYAEAHFATFPPELPRRCILLGTSATGACPDCGAPFYRVVKHRYVHSQTGVPIRLTRVAETLGWRAPCRCPQERPPVPSLVLDPFAGAGTTALVADRLGRDAVGLELSGKYVDMARKRIRSEAPLFATAEEVA